MDARAYPQTLQPVWNGGDGPHRHVVGRPLLVAGGDPPQALEPVDQPFVDEAGIA